MKIKSDNQFRCWLWFMENRQEELYDIVNMMINEKINEVVPQIVQDELRQNVDKLSYNIQTTINGHSSSSFKDMITEEIIKELQN